jgi:flavoprotein
MRGKLVIMGAGHFPQQQAMRQSHALVVRCARCPMRSLSDALVGGALEQRQAQVKMENVERLVRMRPPSQFISRGMTS